MWTAAWGFAAGGLYSWYDEDFGGDRDLKEAYGFFEISHDLAQDWIVWGQVMYMSLDSDELLEEEVLELSSFLRVPMPALEYLSARTA